MKGTSSGSGGPKSSLSGRPPRERISLARRGYMIANNSASAARSRFGASSAGGSATGATGGGSAGMAAGASASASVISPMVQCSLQAARSVAALSASRFSRRLQPRQQRARLARLAQTAVALGGALAGPHLISLGELARQADAVHRVQRGGDALRAEVGLVGVTGQHGRHLRDRGVVAAGAFLGGVVDRRQQGAAQVVDQHVVDVAGEAERGVGRFGLQLVVHGGEVWC